MQSFSWDFGNGAVQDTSDPSQPVTVTYPGPGEYFVRLAMVDASGFWTLDDPAGLVSPEGLVSLENQDGRLVWTVNE
ncbi:MAG: PKD domain-containing protein [Planctomycetota bacterium]